MSDTETPVVTIVDYGVGNIGGLVNMLDMLMVEANVTSDARAISESRKLILPGVGSFDHAMARLFQLKLIDPIQTAAKNECQILGICLGMQLLGHSSEEGKLAGLGLINAVTQKIPPLDGLKVPNMGWASPRIRSPNSLMPLSAEAERFYFAHSFHMVCRDPALISATIKYGSEIACAVRFGNLYGVQFHPEKSHRFGMRLLRSFTDLCAAPE